jgi:predicted phage baseplate assembly protein
MKIAKSRELSRTGFLLSAKVTQLELQADATTLDALGGLPIRTTAILGSTDQYTVAEEPVPDPISGTAITLATAQLRLTPGQQVVVTGAARHQSASKVSEVRTIAAVALVDGYTQVTLDLDLDHDYDPASVTINANVAPATQGASKSEILGSGDGTASYQKFALKQPPLTYVSAATRSGIASTLQVRVNGIEWQEAPWLAGEGPTQPVYVTFADERGNTIVEFGDGAENGARLPSGQNNVTATYRQGIGSAGNVGPGLITTLLTRPLGVQSVINPVAASGGGDPETIDTARRNVPTTTRALDRIVALEDVGDFARATASIAKAEAVWAWDGRRHVACVTVAAPGGAAVDPTSNQFHNLIGAMRGASDGTFPIVPCSYVPRSFALGATLTTDPSRDADAVVAAAKDALRAAFGFDARDFMQPVFLSEIFAVLQAVPGVVAAIIDVFRFSDASASDPAVSPYPLPANPPVLAGGVLVGAELLTLEPGLLPAVVHA